MAKHKVVLEYDDVTTELKDNYGNFVVSWGLDESHFLKELKEQSTSNTQEDIKGLVSSGISVDDIIKLKNAGLL